MKVIIILVLVLLSSGTDFCSKSIILRDISLPVPLKRQYLKDIENIVHASADLIMNMNSTELTLNWKKCSHDAESPNSYTSYVDDINYNLMHMKVDTDLESIGFEVNEADDIIESIIYNANYIFEMMLKSISFSVSSSIVLGVKDVLKLDMYKSGDKQSNICKLSNRIWDTDLNYLKQHIPTDKSIKATPKWIKPRFDNFTNSIVRDYVYPIYVKDLYYGLAVLTIDYEDMFVDITKAHDPSEAYHFVVSAVDATVYSASQEMMKLLFNTTNTVTEQFQTEYYSIVNSTTGFENIIKLFLVDQKTETEIDCNVDNHRYYVTAVFDLDYDFVMITVIPTTNLYGAKWRIFPEIIDFNYSDINDKPTSEVTIINEGKYNATFSLETNFQLNITEYIGIQILPYHNKTITLELDIHKLMNIYGLYILLQPNGTNSECYSTIVAGISVKDISCKVDNLKYYLEECDGANQHLHFEWNKSTKCEGGIELPKELAIACQWMNNDIGFKTFTIIIVAIYLVIVVFIIINTFVHYTQLRGIIIPVFLYTYIIGLLLRQIALLFFAFSELNKDHCNAYQILDSLGTIAMCCTITVTLRQGYIKYIKRHIIRIHEYYYLALHLLPFLILLAIILSVTHPFYDSWTVQQDYDLEVTIDTCISNNFVKEFFVDIPVYIVIIINLFYGTLLILNRKGLGITIIQFSRGANCVTVCLLAHPLLKYLTKNGYPDVTATGYCYAIELLILTIYQLWFIPVRQWICCKNNDISPEYKILFMQILNDPLSRYYLKEHMKTLRQEENIIFWEAVNELQINEVEEPHLSMCVKHIYERFINEKGDLEININDTMKKRITDEITKGNTDLSIYDEAMKEIEQLIYVNAYHTYKSSSDSESASTLLSWYSNFDTIPDTLQSSVYRKIIHDKPFLSPFCYFIDGFEKIPNWQTSTGFNSLLSPFHTTMNQSARTSTTFKFVPSKAPSNNPSRNTSATFKSPSMSTKENTNRLTKSAINVTTKSQTYSVRGSKTNSQTEKNCLNTTLIEVSPTGLKHIEEEN